LREGLHRPRAATSGYEQRDQNYSLPMDRPRWLLPLLIGVSVFLAGTLAFVLVRNDREGAAVLPFTLFAMAMLTGAELERQQARR
jgi:uncharacterized membrane protein